MLNFLRLLLGCCLLYSVITCGRCRSEIRCPENEEEIDDCDCDEGKKVGELCCVCKCGYFRNKYGDCEKGGNSDTICNLPSAKGNGTQELTRWYYNYKKKCCETFIYSGEGGNFNNFKSRFDCENACGSKDICSLEPHPGTGNSDFIRWYFSPDDRYCFPFHYKGMGGNCNNFMSSAECLDICQTKITPGRCPANEKEIDDCDCDEGKKVGKLCCVCIDGYVRNKHGDCVKREKCDVTPGRCPDNEKEIDDCDCDKGKKVGKLCCVCIDGYVRNKHGDCVKREKCDDICDLPPECGYGNQELMRWYFNKDKGCCYTFTYYGKGGNANNFEFKSDCEESCGSRDICKLPPDPGYGNKNSIRWYFNPKNPKYCYPFLYKGMGGNCNNFLTSKGCLKFCGKKIPKCKDENEQYYEHMPNCKNTCENYNNPGVRCAEGPPGCFCREGLVKRKDGKCVEPKDCCDDICTLPYCSGYGSQNLVRWYFDSNYPQYCYPFMYRGMGGNANNFLSYAECLKRCGPKKKCGNNEEYLDCGTACPDTCDNYGQTRACPAHCVSGCFCIKGYVRNNKGECVKPKDCPKNTCHPPPKCNCKDDCYLPPDCGHGNKKQTRWYLNKKTGCCETFTYKGQGGNSNNFGSKEECEKCCGKKEPKYESPICSCKDCRLVIRKREKCPCCLCKKNGKIALEKVTCRPGCRLVSVKWDCCPVCECDPCGTPVTPTCDDICCLPPHQGYGNQKLIRWYFNPNKPQYCYPFIYKGMGGNANNFPCSETCLRHCGPKSTPDPPSWD